MNDNAIEKSSVRKAGATAKGRASQTAKKPAPARGGTVGAKTALRANPDIATQAQAHTKAALAAFVAVMQDASSPAAARVAAATQILTWGYGKGAGGESDSGERTVRLAWEG
ncbi:MAG: hypothetical protein WD711_13720 [Dongiaceae bacterium]